MRMGGLQVSAPAAALALPVAAAARLAATAEAAAPALGGLARAGGCIYHVAPLARKPHVQPAANYRAVRKSRSRKISL